MQLKRNAKSSLSPFLAVLACAFTAVSLWACGNSTAAFECQSGTRCWSQSNDDFDGTYPSSDGGAGGQSLVWVWYDFANSLAAVAAHPESFTHVSPALYQINYDYASGVPQFYGGDDNFDGLTSAQIAAQIRGMGKKCVPLIFGGGTNLGTDQGIQNILNDSPAGAQASFINSLVTEGLAKGYDGWNLDWEVDRNAGTTYAAYGTKLTHFLSVLKAALHQHGMTLSFDLGTWYLKQTYCSGGSGVVDLTALAPTVDLAILENYVSQLEGGSECPLSLPNPQTCDGNFVSALNLMCAYLPLDVISIGLNAKGGSSNLIAGPTLETLRRYGIKNVAIWPDYNALGPGGSYVFLDNTSINPAGTTWYALLSNFLE